MKVFFAEPYATNSTAKLRTQRGIEITTDISECEVLLIRSGTRVDETLLQKIPHLKLVVTATSGFDHIDWRACRSRNITVTYTPEANAGSTAELTMFLVSALVRKTLPQIENVRKGKWREGLFRGESLEGKTLGIVGLGRVGARVAELARAYRMSLVGHDPYVSPEVFAKFAIERMSMIEVLKGSDIVTFHVPLTKETKYFINQATIAEMSASYLVNASRGAVVDESEVLVALRNNKLDGAAFDVMEREPPQVGNELLRHPKVIVTPHVGAFTLQAFERASDAAVERVIQFNSGNPIPETLPLSVPWFE